MLINKEKPLLTDPKSDPTLWPDPDVGRTKFLQFCEFDDSEVDCIGLDLYSEGKLFRVSSRVAVEQHKLAFEAFFQSIVPLDENRQCGALFCMKPPPCSFLDKVFNV